jgi:hypothetical protein
VLHYRFPQVSTERLLLATAAALALALPAALTFGFPNGNGGYTDKRPNGTTFVNPNGGGYTVVGPAARCSSTRTAAAALTSIGPPNSSFRKGSSPPLGRGLAPHTGRPRGETIADIVIKLHKTGGGGANSIHSGARVAWSWRSRRRSRTAPARTRPRLRRTPQPAAPGKARKGDLVLFIADKNSVRGKLGGAKFPTRMTTVDRQG